VDARYRARAERLPPLRWDHPGLLRVAAWRASGRPRAQSLAVARDALAGRFSFQGREETFGEQVAWFRPDLDAGTRLWKTLLHEFGYALDLATAAEDDPRYRVRLFALARSWRAAAPIGCRGFALDAWNARAVATRLIHWAVAGRVLGLRSGEPDADWLGREIGLHGLFLRDNLELDLRGNHLFRDAVGLVFAQELVGGVPDALDWLERQVAEQVLPDGCHAERAPFYHALCCQDLLEVALLLGEARPAWLSDALARMSGLLEAIALGDGEIPLLGDGWLGELDTRAILGRARELVAPLPTRDPERHGGLVPLHAPPWRVVVRAGPHAPDEQMGHAHADLLSFDASHGDTRIVTDTGTLLYDPGPERQRVRGTAAHNTLALDGEEQLEAWGSFRVGRRGRARVIARGREGTWQWLSASHDAYARLPGRPRHHRLLAVSERGVLVLDAVLGSGRHRVESHLHQHPAQQGSGIGIAALGAAARHEPAPLHEHFGQTRGMQRLVVEQTDSLPWAGGWWIAAGAGETSAGTLSLDGALVRAQLVDPGLDLTWRPGCADAEEAVSLCSAPRGSAK
jgi:uncharacterized heparinase superfamily protein